MARVLVIEDHPANRDLMVYLLTAFGHSALAAANGLHGLEAARRQAPDLIVCDLQLPDIDGYQVIQQVRADPVLRATPVVAVTAYAMLGDREGALAAGFDGYITKPIEPEIFVGQLERFLRSS
jgi:two-component system cell cycle response regulator